MKSENQNQPSRKAVLIERNKQVRACFYATQKKYPKYKVEVIIQEVAQKFFLAPRTIEAIIGYEGTYKE